MVAVFAISQPMRQELRLRQQLSDSAESIPANIAEGFNQSTDRAFARYLGIAAGSAGELRVHLDAVAEIGVVRRERVAELINEAREMENMLDGFIRYLRRCDRKDRHRTPPDDD